MDEAQRNLRALEIDEEGYPVVGGLRLDDFELLREINSNLSFVDSQNPRSALITTFGGQRCLLAPFSEPLVAQQIEWVNDHESRWQFLGGLSALVSHNRIRIDEWNRLHALVFDQQLPATATRQAQTSYLLHERAPTAFESYYPQLDATVLVSDDFWDKRYQTKEIGWDLGRESPVLASEWAQLRPRLKGDEELVVVGAGLGHDAHFFNQQGQSVLGLDSSPTAEHQARLRYPNLRYQVADAFEWARAHSGVGAIFEHTFFCAIHPSLRRSWLKQAFEALKPGGLYLGVFWFLYRPSGPPFGLTQWELRELSRDLFLIKDWRLSHASVDRRFGQEYWIVFQKPH